MAAPGSKEFAWWYAQYNRKGRTPDPSQVPRIEYDDTNYMTSPFDPSGWDGASDPDATFTVIQESNPSGRESIAVISDSTGVFAINRPALPTGLTGSIGEKLYTSILVRPQDDFSLLFRLSGSGSQISLDSVNAQSAVSGMDLKIVDFEDGWRLIEREYVLSQAYENLAGWCLIDGTSISPEPFYAQATFFGKADDYPAVVK